MRRTAYTFRVPGPVFKAGLIFPSFFLLYFLAHFFSLPTYQRCRCCSNSTILLLYCLVFFSSCAQLRDTAGPNIFQIAKNKLLTFAALFSHRFQQGRCCPNPTQYCLYPGLKGASATQTGTLTAAASLSYQHTYKTKK